MNTREIGVLDVGHGVRTLRADELGAVTPDIRLMTDAELDAVNGAVVDLAIFLVCAFAGYGAVRLGADIVNLARGPEVLVPNLFP